MLRELGGIASMKYLYLILRTWRYNDTVSICIGPSLIHLVLGDFKNTGTPLSSWTTESDRFDDWFDFRKAANV
jgi:hypothetical protein